MINFIARFGEDTRFCAVTYLLPLILPSIHLSTGWILLPIGASLLLIIAVLAPKASQLKFHAIQSIFLYGVSFSGVIMIYLFVLYGGRSGGHAITALIYLGMVGIFLAVMSLGFLLLIGALFLKTWRGKTVQLPLLGEWALDAKEGDYWVLKWIGVLLGILLAIQLTIYYQKEEKLKQPVVISENLLSELTTYLEAFPIGSTKEDVYKKAQEIGNKSPLRHSQEWGTDYKEITFSGYPARLLFVVGEDKGKSNLHKMNIMMQSYNGPVAEIYSQLYKELKGKYGMPLQEGYPPWREVGTKVWGSGEGALWEITPANGMPFMLMISLEPEQRKGDGLGKFYVECRIKESKQGGQ